MKGIKCILLSMCVIVGVLASVVDAKEVAKFSYKGKPEVFHQKSMTVPSEMVALSEYQYVPDFSESSSDTLYQPSIMFIIDHSGSMKQNDPEKARFKVTNALLDTLMRKCPLAEVGVLIFAGKLEYWKGNQNANIDDDPYNASCPGEVGGYCPLYQLNKTYNGKTGYEILKSYVELNPAGRLAYKSNWSLSGTNITTGVNASKHAFTNTQRVKARHFNVFYSDGSASLPEDDPDQYVVGTDVATIFTVYFQEDGASPPPQTLRDFTSNVKKNGYSSNNPKSDIWSMQNVGVDTLLSFVMKNVMNTILKEGYMVPFEMTVNKGAVVNNWLNDSTGFTFARLFPLKAKETDFVFDIGYHKRHIFVDPNTGIIDTVNRDTTHTIEFTVEVDANQAPLDSMWEVKRWDRTLGFYYNSTLVNSIKSGMNELEIRFEYDPGEAEYNYIKVTIEVTNTSPNGRDNERVSLTKRGNLFSGKIKRELIANSNNPTTSDNILQHYQSDNVSAVFRNDETPKLILDTLKITAPFEFDGEFTVTKAYYFDDSADGYVDSIRIEAQTTNSSGITKNHIQEILDNALTLPVFRDFSVTGYDVVGNGFYLLVKEDKGHGPVTSVTKDDVLKFKNYNFTSGELLSKRDIIPIDKVAPLIHWKDRSVLALVHQDEFVMDTLMITFTEPVKHIAASVPFRLLSITGNTRYTAKLDPINQPSPEQMVFAIQSLSGVEKMHDGDSIWIYEGDRVGDVCKDASGNTVTNFQNNPRNTKRRVYIDYRLLPFTYSPKAVSPVTVKNISNTTNYEIPDSHVSIFKKQGMLNDLGLSKNNDGKYVGMIINVVPDNLENVFENFKLKGAISILDPLGNRIIENKKMGWDNEKKRLIYVWNLKNRNGRYVGSSMYVSLIEIEETTDGAENSGLTDVKKLLLGVK